MSLWLTPDELVELTGYKQRAKQLIALAELNIRPTIRPADQFPLVLREQVPNLPTKPAKVKRKEPNFEVA